MTLQIIPVEGAALMRRFIRLPATLNAHDPNWITPLEMEREESFSPRKNPLFSHTEVRFWLAVRAGRDVGRISAQIEASNVARGDMTGYFGCLAGEDDAGVFKALFDAAEGWLKQQGMTQVIGPFTLGINEEAGLLVEGFDTPPMLLMGHDQPYVARRVAAAGYAKAKDIYAYLAEIAEEMPRAAQLLLKRKRPAGITLRPLSFKHYARDIASITEIFNEAWMDNWRFAPLTREDTDHLAKALRPILNEQLVWFVDIDGEPAGFGVCLPNINEALVGLDGKLLPLGWAKLLYRLKVRGVKSCRVPLMGVKRRYAGTFAGAVMPFLIIDAMRREALAIGYEKVELSWVLEDNQPMRNFCETYGAVPYKTYRLFEKALA
jgi:hypothetical protein